MTDDGGEKLIVEVQKNPQLYDKSNRLYKDATKKRDIWDAIGRTLGISGDSARKKWTNIRDAFHLSRKKRCKSGDAAKFVKPYKYAGILEFMIPHLQYRETSGNLQNEDEEAGEDPCEGQSEQTPQRLRTTDPGTSTPNSSLKKSGERAQSSLDSAILEYLEGRKQQQEDELDTFFKSMATSMRKMPENTRAMLKFQIHELVHRAEMETIYQMHSSQASVWDSSMDSFH